MTLVGRERWALLWSYRALARYFTGGHVMNTSLRVTGWGTLGFAIAFFVTFAVNQALNTVIDYPRSPSAADMAADFGGGVAFILLWGSAGIALVTAAVS